MVLHCTSMLLPDHAFHARSMAVVGAPPTARYY